MDKRQLQAYAVWAKENLETQIEVSLKTLGIFSDTDIKNAKIIGDVVVIDGDDHSYPRDLYSKRNNIVNLVKSEGYKQVIEEFAYTWFNRFVALRFMEVHNFFPHGFRVLSSRDGSVEPEVLKNLTLVRGDLELNLETCATLQEKGGIEELFRYVLLCQCRALAGILPMLFEDKNDYIDLLLPKSLLLGDTVVTKLIALGEEVFLEDVEVIGWLYQFYVADDRQAFRDAKVVTKDLIPTLTQVFTPDWIVRYMAENSIGRLWLESNPSSSLRELMKYYVEDAKQEPDIEKKLNAIRYQNVNPEDIKIIEPCCGSGHILVYVFDLLYKMYEEKGYSAREIPTLILSKNIFGLEIDKRAAQLSSFSLIMKAREMNNRFFSKNYFCMPNVAEIYDSRYFLSCDYRKEFSELSIITNAEIVAIESLVETFRYGKTIGALLEMPKIDVAAVETAIEKLKNDVVPTIFNAEFINKCVALLPKLLRQYKIMADKYDVMITNPPYLGFSKMEAAPKEYLIAKYPRSKSDMFAMFMEVPYVKPNGFRAMVNPDSWMFLVSYEEMRKKIILSESIVNMVHLGLGAFDATVQTTSFVIRNAAIAGNGVYFRLVDSKDKENDFVNNLSNGGRVLFIVDAIKFTKIPGYPIAYWAGSLFEIFSNQKTISSKAIARSGLSTGDNELYLRLWWEINLDQIGFGFNDNEEFLESGKKFVPCNKGGDFRRWYGNNEHIVKWCDSQKFHRPRSTYVNLYYRPALTWTVLTTGKFCTRYYGKGFLFDHAAASLFPNKEDDTMSFIGYMNTRVANYILDLINPTLNTGADVVLRMPFIELDMIQKCVVGNFASDNIQSCITDWDSFETSWDFKKHPLI